MILFLTGCSAASEPQIQYIEKEVIIEKIVEVPVEVIVEKETIVEKEIIVEVEKETIIEKIVEKEVVVEISNELLQLITTKNQFDQLTIGQRIENLYCNYLFYDTEYQISMYDKYGNQILSKVVCGTITNLNIRRKMGNTYECQIFIDYDYCESLAMHIYNKAN